MGACAEREVALAFCTPKGRFLARVCGESTGNVLLRRTQYRIADDPDRCCPLARSMVFGKVYNARWSIERTCRDHALRVDAAALKESSAQLGVAFADCGIGLDGQPARAGGRGGDRLFRRL